MLYIYQAEFEDDAAASTAHHDLTVPERVQADVAFSYGQGPAYIVVVADREVTAEELGLPELKLVETMNEELIADAAARSLLEALGGANEITGMDKLLRFAGEEDGEPEQGAGDGAGE